MKKSFVLALIVITVLSLAACGNTGSTDTTPGEDYKKQEDVTIDENEEPDDAEDKKVEITGDFSITSSDNETGFTYVDGVATITGEGEYVLTGSLGGGKVVVNCDGGEVTLTLNGTSITNSSECPINVLAAKKVTINVADGTYNEINDTRSQKVTTTSTTTDTETEDDNGNSAIWADCDIKIEGTGALVVTSTYNNGIQSKDKVTISKCTLKVTAVNHALKGNDAVNINSGEIVLNSSTGDGIKTSNSSVSEKGNQKGTVTISGGTILIEAYGDGIDSAYNVEVSDSCELTIKTGSYAGYKTSSSSSSSGSSRGGFGGFGGGGWGGTSSSSSSKTSYSTKGIKAGNEVIINGGKIQIEASDDAVHANQDTLENSSTGVGNVTINGGEIQIKSADDGIHAESTVTINDGTVVVTESYEGIEGSKIEFNGGVIDVYASDDGLNAFGGTGMGGMGGFGGGGRGGFGGGGSRGGTTTTTTTEDTPCITINGGCITVETPSGDTDAIDSNGNFIMTGGFILVKGGASTGSMAGSIDTDGTVSVTGGTCIALGGICELPITGSCNYVTIQRKTFSTGDYAITDGSGTVIAEFSLDSTFQSAWICSNAFVKGNSYTLTRNGSTYVSWKQSTMSASAS